MTTDELRAAAEMVVATGMHKDWADTIDAGAVEVCRDWLKDHPNDDNEPVTEGWLRAVGFRFLAGYGRGEWVIGDTRETLPQVLSCSQDFLTWTYGCCHVVPPVTRGHVRRLCLALGIPIKESA